MTGSRSALAAMPAEAGEHPSVPVEAGGYHLDGQVGFLLRQAQQRHVAIFSEAFGDDLTPLQWAATAKLAEIGECSQNRLGRLIATDVATIKGVVERLLRRGEVATRPDPTDKRRLLLRLTRGGETAYRSRAATAAGVTDRTLAPLSDSERTALLRLLGRLASGLA